MFLHNLQNVLVQIANKMGSQKKKCSEEVRSFQKYYINNEEEEDGVDT
jgi:hypothetical protein